MSNVRTALHYHIFVWVVLVIFFIADRVTKFLALYVLSRDGVFAYDHALGFFLERNRGIAFSLPLPGYIIGIVVLGVVVYLVWLMKESQSRAEYPVVWGAGFMIVGALANACDRIRFGYVIDFIRLTRWPTFNLADVYISIGVSILIGFYLFKSNPYARSTAHSNDRRN
jgi:signal peptidase II